MPSFAQFATNEVQKSGLVSQFVSAYELGSRKAPSGSELRQLQEELERISGHASARVLQLEQSHAYLKSKPSEGGGERVVSKRDRDSTRLEDSPLSQTLSNAATDIVSATVLALPGLAGTSIDKPASKRVKPSLATGRGTGSESDNSAQISSNVGGDGKYFESAATAPVGGDYLATPPAKVRHSTGTPVQEDFSRVKVANQVQIQTFWASLEPYFRSITDDDLAFLEKTSDNQEAYTTPRLGKFYARAWAEEEVNHFPDHMSNNKTRYAAKHLLGSEARSQSQPAAATAATATAVSFPGGKLVDSDLSLNSARLAPLTERIISALVAERLVLNGESNGAGIAAGSDSASEESDDGMEPRQLSSSGETISLEDRLKRELRYIGILDDDDIDWDGREDDEVCVTMRSLQRQLREQTRINALRKERLLPIAKEHTGYQEYTQVIDELDKQVEQSYLKRHRLTKSRKRKSAAATATKTVGLSDNALNAMDRRRRVTQAIGHLFPAEKFGLVTESVFEGIPDNPDIENQITM
ncbi:Transcriptional regulator [Coemansia sp. BCRC 34301]|nr:Transcriptional regulator [Coemansia sp. BCRC 34301]